MKALVVVHCISKRITPKEVLRLAYMWKFGKDMPSKSLDEDTREYLYQGNLQPYAVDYLLSIYGTRS